MFKKIIRFIFKLIIVSAVLIFLFIKFRTLFYIVVGSYYSFCLIKFIFYYSRIGFLKQFEQALNFFMIDFAYVVAISGAIRVGKTTFMAAASHLLTFRILDHINSKMCEIERILNEVNFSTVINMYDSFGDLDHELRVEKILEDLSYFDDFDNSQLIYSLDSLHFDSLKYQSYTSLLKDYLYFYMHSKRNDFVFSRTKAFNQITMNYSLPLNPEWEKLKDKNDFPLDEFSIFLDDEKLLDSSNIKNGGRAEDNGTDVFFRLFGHLFRERSWYITSAQKASRWVKAEREIAQFHVYLKKSYLVGDYPKIKRLLDILENINQLVYRIYMIFRKDGFYFDNNNFFKKISKWILLKQKYLTSKGFIMFCANCYKDVDMVGKDLSKDNDSSENYSFDFTVPVIYCWDICNTHAFHGVIDKLHEQSKLTRDDLSRVELDMDQLDIDRFLQKAKDKKNDFSDDVPLRKQIIN